MPLTAQHPELGLLDASTEELRHGEGAWPRVYKVRPRAPLTCRGCGHGLHAKVSPNGLRFFSHDAAQSQCPTAGESLAHRLLKLELVSAAQAAGWEAELEVAGNGWRADVLATSPEGRQVAWEAQLAQITPKEIVQRHSTMTADGLEVCWVADRHRAWIGQVPAIAVAPAHPETGETDLQVVAGHARFEPSWCEDRRSCEEVPDFGRYAQEAGPCAGHGQWETPPPLPLASFVAAVCANSLRCLTLLERHGTRGSAQARQLLLGPRVATASPSANRSSPGGHVRCSSSAWTPSGSATSGTLRPSWSVSRRSASPPRLGSAS